MTATAEAHVVGRQYEDQSRIAGGRLAANSTLPSRSPCTSCEGSSTGRRACTSGSTSAIAAADAWTGSSFQATRSASDHRSARWSKERWAGQVGDRGVEGKSSVLHVIGAVDIGVTGDELAGLPTLGYPCPPRASGSGGRARRTWVESGGSGPDIVDHQKFRTRFTVTRVRCDCFAWRKRTSSLSVSQVNEVPSREPGTVTITVCGVLCAAVGEHMGTVARSSFRPDLPLRLGHPQCQGQRGRPCMPGTSTGGGP